MITFTIPGAPRGKGRPRFSGRGGFPRTYTDAKTKAYEQLVKKSYLEAGGEMMDGQISISITAVFEPPKSLSKKKRAELIGQYHTKKPDLDNIIKSILDGLNGVAYPDDGIISEIAAKKIYGETAGVVVEINQKGE